MGGVGQKLTPTVVRCLLGLLRWSGPITDTSWAHSYSNQCLYGCFCHLPSHAHFAGLKLEHTRKSSKTPKVHQAAVS